MATITISLPDTLKSFVDSQMETKGYGNVSEYFRSLLRDAQEKEKEARLESLLLEGLASGKGEVADAAFWSDLKAEAAELLAARSRKSGAR
ncbi:type II toxin-antitoxin system ParD family antitoxin [Shinella sumterensis]|jgi:antitoxin ParD1/3/4|uniref:type II toxin-antitoxin system ParD family antitoxin n=1 Tax=Shinella sumterensis TaxID=1967501 RepID=UPI003F84A33F